MKCSFKGCVKDAFCKGLCGSHYAQQRQGKELKPLQEQFHGLSEIERFEKRVALHPTGCKVWLGAIQTMQNRPKAEWHGQWRNAAGEHELTHRAAWRMYRGPITQGAFVLHTCDNPRCVNPDHLYLGTQADNVRDMWDRSRAAPGISRGSKHGMSVIDEAQVREIRDSKESGPAIAKRLGISTTTVYDVRNRKIWKHVE